MLEWLICAASVATQVPADSGIASKASGRADFFEFLADWDEDDAKALDVDADGGDEGAFVGSERGEARTREKSPFRSTSPREEEMR